MPYKGNAVMFPIAVKEEQILRKSDFWVTQDLFDVGVCITEEEGKKKMTGCPGR